MSAAITGGVSKTRMVDQVVVNNGTIPLDELYFELKPLSINGGEVGYDELVDGLPQSVSRTRRAASSCSGSAMPVSAATPMRRSTTLCGW